MTNKKYLVAGASRGIGYAVAQKLLSSGNRVIAVAESAEDLLTAYDGIENVETFVCDFFDLSSIEKLAKNINAASGAIDGLVYTAGMQMTMPLAMGKPEKMQQIFTLNSFAAFELIRCFSKRKMTAENGASFVLISSLSAHEGAAGKTLYAASKGALEGYIPPAAYELSQRNIRLNGVCFGIIDTAMSQEFLNVMSEEQRKTTEYGYPLGIGKPEDAAALICWLLSDESRWATGQIYTLDGGHSIRAC